MFSIKYKVVILETLSWLHTNRKVFIHAFVIMPNHVHLLWSPHPTARDYNYAHAFTSYTAHIFKQIMPIDLLNTYRVNKDDRLYNFWQEKPHSFEIDTRRSAEQKLDYIHHNPVEGVWNLADTYLDYPYSSARYYELDETDYRFLTHYVDFI